MKDGNFGWQRITNETVLCGAGSGRVKDATAQQQQQQQEQQYQHHQEESIGVGAKSKRARQSISAVCNAWMLIGHDDEHSTWTGLQRGSSISHLAESPSRSVARSSVLEDPLKLV
ncbi:hypothetical protein PV326_006177 [Microctonus aethiopoides]|nr:hypothetical protein PV326_006177 [Microctonus aethiopoides]